jgi:hypothetical protein
MYPSTVARLQFGKKSFGWAVFYEVRVISKGSKRLVIPGKYFFKFLTFCTFSIFLMQRFGDWTLLQTSLNIYTQLCPTDRAYFYEFNRVWL